MPVLTINAGTVVLIHLTIVNGDDDGMLNNTASDDGQTSGIFNDDTVTLPSSTVAGNSAGQGGETYNS